MFLEKFLIIWEIIELLLVLLIATNEREEFKLISMSSIKLVSLSELLVKLFISRDNWSNR